MNAHSPTWYRRWFVFGPGVAASVFPALVLMLSFETRPGDYLSTFLAFWVELLVGPVKYWVPILFGNPSPYGLHPMPGALTWLYGVCLPMSLAHPLKPRALTGFVTIAAFGVWYCWAFLTLGAFEY
jgi:hypothetical protein